MADAVAQSDRKVCIIGAGMTGLCACKHLLQHGFEPTILEARDCIGGIWRNTASITQLQTARDGYQFSDFPWPEGTPPFPRNDQVVEYLESYATRFHIKERISFNCKVVEIKSRMVDDNNITGLWGNNGRAFASEEEENGGKIWQVRAQKQSPGRQHNEIEAADEEWLDFDYLVICVGRFGDFPKFPTFPHGRGIEIFSGEALHSMEYGMMDNKAARQLLNGKRVIVVGYMKSAIDIIIEATDFNQGVHGHPCHLIYRTTNWVVLNQKFFRKLVSYAYFTRLSELLSSKPDQGFLLGVLSTCLFPLRWACSKAAELYLQSNLPLRKYGLIPKHSFFDHASSCKLFVLPDPFFPRIEKGEIILHQANEWSFCKKGVLLDDGTEIEADVVILGTGYDGNKKLMSVLPKDYASVLEDPSGVIPLYRGAIHPRIPHLAILGYQLKFSHLHSSELSARWLAYFLSGKFVLPSIVDMEKDAQSWVQHMQTVSSFPQQACLGAAAIWQSDQLCKDMGWNPWRKKNLIQEFVSPYSNMDYKD